MRKLHVAVDSWPERRDVCMFNDHLTPVPQKRLRGVFRSHSFRQTGKHGREKGETVATKLGHKLSFVSAMHEATAQ